MLKYVFFILCSILFCNSLLPTAEAAESTGLQQAHKMKIIINIPSRLLTLFSDGKAVCMYAVGIGRFDAPTPVGEYQILSKEINPTWIKPGEEVVKIESGPDNPLGYRWMQIEGNYGIHGTNQPNSIGGYVSSGCIRMREADVEELYDLVPIGTPVSIIYKRLVIERSPDKVVTFYIYPDEYHSQPLDIQAVNKKLAEFGVDRFVSDEKISEKLLAANGEATFIGKSFSVMVNEQKLDMAGVVQSGMVYLPVMPIASQLKLAVNWNKDSASLNTAYGTVPGYVKKDILYMNAKDVDKLFHLELDWHDSDNLFLNRKISMNTTMSTTPAASIPVSGSAVIVKPGSKSIDNTPMMPDFGKMERVKN
jgi:hypothetical protein